MKRRLVSITLGLALLMGTISMTGCTEAELASYNLSRDADNFNVVRQLTVINCIEGDVLFQMSGKLSITVEDMDKQLEITVKDGESYVKHFVGLADNITYIVEDLNLSAEEVQNYQYKMEYNPDMWLPTKQVD